MITLPNNADTFWRILPSLHLLFLLFVLWQSSFSSSYWPSMWWRTATRQEDLVSNPSTFLGWRTLPVPQTLRPCTQIQYFQVKFSREEFHSEFSTSTALIYPVTMRNNLPWSIFKRERTDLKLTTKVLTESKPSSPSPDPLVLVVLAVTACII